MKTRTLIALFFLILSNTAFASPPKAPSFINDDFQKALTQAKQRDVPLFVDVWAPW